MEKSMDLLVYLWPQKCQKMARFSIENLQIIKAFSIFLGGDIWFLNFTKPKIAQIAHNSFNNGARAVLTPFLDFQFFLTFCLENLVFWVKHKKLTQKSHQHRVQYPKVVQNHVKKWNNGWIYWCIFDPKNSRQWPGFLVKICNSWKFIDFSGWEGKLIFEFHKIKNCS